MSFDAYTRAHEVVASLDLSDSTYLITGGTSGLGKESARCLAARGATIVLMGSSQRRGDAAVEELCAKTGSERISFVRARFERLQDVAAAADHLTNTLTRLDGVIASAGIMATEFGRTDDGLERQFGINHIAHHLLITRLLPVLRAQGGARVVTMTSGAHRLAGIDFDDPNFHVRPYDRWTAYGQSKSANVLFANALDERQARSGVRALTVAPGVVTDTNLHTHLTDDNFAPLMEKQPGLKKLSHAKDSQEGAATMVWAVCHPQLAGCGGYYLEDCGVAFSNADPRDHEDVMPRVRDMNTADRLWELSERLIEQVLDDAKEQA